MYDLFIVINLKIFVWKPNGPKADKWPNTSHFYSTINY